jgi:hypothetical protein
MNEADFIHIAGPSKHRSALNKADELASELSIVYVKVQMFDDVPSFIGSDLMLYSLKKDAIARVPGDISDVLCKRRKQSGLTKIANKKDRAGVPQMLPNSPHLLGIRQDVRERRADRTDMTQKLVYWKDEDYEDEDQLRNVQIRSLSDVSEFIGSDEKMYELTKGEIVRLRSEQACVLIHRKLGTPAHTLNPVN